MSASDKDGKEIMTPADEWEEGDSDRTVIQGIKDLTGSLNSRQASLIVISGASAGKMFKVASEALTIGRGKDCEIMLAEEGISRNHCRIEPDGHGNVAIVDLNSTNGTFFNGNRITRHLLRDGDKVQVGSTTILKFSFQDSLEESFIQNQYEQATRDGLTGVLNKRTFLEKFAAEFAYAIRHNEATSLILFDIDHFKKVNDTYGHQAGDMVLKHLAEVVEHSLREEDVLARYGGEEFAIILRNQNEQRAFVAAERVRRAVEKGEFVWEGQRIPVTISLGIATLVEARFQDPADMLREADEFLYESKRGGRNRTTSVLRRA
ncbi:MAG TPA: GGDEF domain-containing protein [Myxococcota bacterium]|nr:GGDEF domain-containing protein [Myxococcota bacterium]HRY96864.1 GGDEF domain-containing protein [Myxococcota bacterium]